jgi:hypothetical protein
VRRRCLAVAVLALCGLIGCGGGNDNGEDLGNLLDTAQGTHLTAAEHPDGYGRSDCFLCHPAEDIHLVDRTGFGVLPLADIRALVDRKGLQSCVLCHGDNGVSR